MKKQSKVVVMAFFLIIHLNSTPGENGWNQFRGPHGFGIAMDTLALPTEFNHSQNLAWQTSLSEGHSSPCIWDKRIFITGFEDEELETLCVDRGTGEVLWTRSVRADTLEKVHRIHSPAASTPVTDGRRVFVYFGSYGLLCYDFDGNELWQRRLPVPANTFGSAASPIVAGPYLIFNCDSNKASYLEAIDRETGATIWRTDRPGFNSSWSTPMYWQNDGVGELVIYGVWWLSAYDLMSGSIRWSVPGLSDEPSITPVAGEGLVFITSYNMKTNPEVLGLPDFGDLLKTYDVDGNKQLSREEIKDNKSILSRYDADGEGDHPISLFFRWLDADKNERISMQEWDKLIAWVDGFEHENALMAIRPGRAGQEPAIVWKHSRGVPEIPSPLYYDGHVYTVKNGGIVSCVDAQTGEVKYFEKLGAGGPYYSSPVVGDSKIYMSSARGVVTVIATGAEFEVLARNDLHERIMATPAIVGGRLYIRTNQHLYAFGLPNEG